MIGAIMQKRNTKERLILNRNRLSILMSFLMVTLLWPGAGQTGESRLISPYNQLNINNYFAPTPMLKFACPDAPKAVRNLKFKSIYTDKSDGTSIVDPKAKKNYKDDTAALRFYENKISEWAMIYVSAPDRAQAQGECVLEWLYRWAEDDALLGKTNGQGEAVRKWSLASLSSAFLQVKDDERLPAEKKREVMSWLHLVAKTVRDDYSRELDNTSRQNNHMFWAAWGVMITAVLTDDREMMDWSVEKFKFGARQIQKDGTLPHEMGRMTKAFNYHVFAAGPLIMMAETAEKNGIHLYSYKDNAIRRLVDRILTELETDQAYITEETGRDQNLDGTVTAGQLAWMEPYYARFKDPRMKRWIKALRPMEQRRMGGNLSMLFSVEE
jgi:poly(beta-D-mannuronate) lyase